MHQWLTKCDKFDTRVFYLEIIAAWTIYTEINISLFVILNIFFIFHEFIAPETMFQILICEHWSRLLFTRSTAFYLLLSIILILIIVFNHCTIIYTDTSPYYLGMIFIIISL